MTAARQSIRSALEARGLGAPRVDSGTVAADGIVEATCVAPVDAPATPGAVNIRAGIGQHRAGVRRRDRPADVGFVEEFHRIPGAEERADHSPSRNAYPEDNPMFAVTPSQAREEIVTCVSAGLVPLLTSSPGMGKSSIVRKIAEDHRLKLIDLRLSQCTPEDLQGFPMRNGSKATFTPFDVFPIEGEPVPAGHDGWLLFLDELTSATKPVQAAAYKLVLDRMVGSFRLHKNVAIVAAGNKATDKAVVNQMSTALQSRLIHYELEVSADEAVELFYKLGLDHRIISFISYMPSRLMDFRPEHHDKTFPCPRTWEFLSRLIKGQEVDTRMGPRIAGTIGEGTATEFITFAREFDRLPKYRDIVADPKGAEVPAEMSTRYATMSMLVENFDEKGLDAVLTYVERFDIEMQILFCRGAVVRRPEIRHAHGKFADYLRRMVRYLQ